MQTPDFVAKYGPLIHILEGGDDDLEAIAEEEGYTRRDGREWRDTHCRALLGYMRAVRTDYEVLWQQTSGQAATDALLGKLLGNTERELRRLERKVRLLVLLRRLTPPPSQGYRPRRLRKFLVGLFPKINRIDVEPILVMMRRVHRQGGASVFLP